MDSDELQSSVKTIESLLRPDQSKGFPRYENDQYYHVSGAATGNLWCITSFWFAQYYIETGDSNKATELIRWVEQNAMLSTGVMTEQVNPGDGSFISVAPLAWSHAEYLATLLDTITEK
jgi:GH15 family glucan-1,4-alpha-glucosidase